MKRLLMRLLLWMSGYAKEKRQLSVVKLRIGEVPMNFEISSWSFVHKERERREYSLSVWYPALDQHDRFTFSTLQDAMSEGLLVENFIGKSIL